MAEEYTNNQEIVARSINRTEWVELELLNENNVKIGVITGDVTGGSVTLTNDSESDLNRISGSLEMILTSDLSDDYFKINLINRCRIFKYVEDTRTGIQANFNLGICLLGNVQLSTDDNKLSVDLKDLMSLYDGSFSGTLEQAVTINVGANLSDAIQNIAINSDLMGLNINQTLIEHNDLTVPYDVTIDSASNITDLLSELMKLYMGYELFFNQDGILVYRKVKDYSTDLPIEELINSPLIKSYSLTDNHENVKNHIVVLGAINSEDANAPYQYRGESILDDGSELSTNKIEDRKLTISNDKNQSDIACQSQADYELENHTNYSTTCEISIIGNYRLIPNKVIVLEYNEENIANNKIFGRWLINSVNIDFVTGNLMTINLNKLYNAKA